MAEEQLLCKKCGKPLKPLSSKNRYPLVRKYTRSKDFCSGKCAIAFQNDHRYATDVKRVKKKREEAKSQNKKGTLKWDSTLNMMVLVDK